MNTLRYKILSGRIQLRFTSHVLPSYRLLWKRKILAAAAAIQYRPSSWMFFKMDDKRGCVYAFENLFFSRLVYSPSLQLRRSATWWRATKCHFDLRLASTNLPISFPNVLKAALSSILFLFIFELFRFYSPTVCFGNRRKTRFHLFTLYFSVVNRTSHPWFRFRQYKGRFFPSFFYTTWLIRPDWTCIFNCCLFAMLT